MAEYWIQYVGAPVVAGIIACAAVIVARAPNAQGLLNKLLPYKAFIGIGMLGLGVYNAISFLPDIGDAFSASAFYGATGLVVIASQLLIGTLFGLPLIAKWAAGRGIGGQAEQRAALVSEKLVKYEVPIGVLSIAGAVMFALMLLKIVGPFA